MSAGPPRVMVTTLSRSAYEQQPVMRPACSIAGPACPSKRTVLDGRRHRQHHTSSARGNRERMVRRGWRTEGSVLVQGAGCGALVGVDETVVRPLCRREHACGLESVQQGGQEPWERLRSPRRQTDAAKIHWSSPSTARPTTHAVTHSESHFQCVYPDQSKVFEGCRVGGTSVTAAEPGLPPKFSVWRP
jgi:hypothetical protein